MTPTRTIDFRFQPTIQQTCICLVDDHHKTIVREDGSLNYDWAGVLDFSNERLNYADNVSQETRPTNDNHFFTYRLKPRVSHRDRLLERKQEFGDPRVAIVRTVERYAETVLAWDAFAFADDASGLRADVILWELSVSEDFGHAPTRVELELHGPREGAPAVWESSDTTDFYSYEGLRLPGLDLYQFIRGGDSRRGVFAIVLEGEIDPASVTWQWGVFAREQTRQYWLNLRPFRKSFAIPDNAVQEMLESCGRNILQAREERDGIIEYQVGPTVYRGLWAVDGHFFLEAAEIMNRRTIAFEQGLLAVLKRIQPNGSLEIIPAHFKETGIAIATIVRQCELMNDIDRLRELWPTILRAVEHIRRLRKRARDMGADYPGYHLFPPAILDGGIEGPFPEYTTPAWILFGLRLAHKAGVRWNLPTADGIGDLYNEIYRGFITSAERDTRLTADGIPYIPMSMIESEYNRPQTATWALAHAIYPGEVFEPEHPFVTNLLALLDSVDDEEGIPIETGWIHHQALWAYSSMFYAQVWLYAGHPEKAIDYIYAFANHAAPSRVWREEQTLRSSHSAEYCGDMPHNWGSVEFIRMVRNAVVMERGDVLELLAGLPPEWLPNSDAALEIEETPTRFGSVSVKLALSGRGTNRYRLEFRRTSGAVEPQEIGVFWNGERRSDLILPDADGEIVTVELDAFENPGKK
jgi:hypothetical protein